LRRVVHQPVAVVIAAIADFGLTRMNRAVAIVAVRPFLAPISVAVAVAVLTSRLGTGHRVVGTERGRALGQKNTRGHRNRRSGEQSAHW
jgi:hypothetical protein